MLEGTRDRTRHGLHARWPGSRPCHGNRAADTLQGAGHNFRWQAQVLAQVDNALIGQVPIAVAPGKGLADQATRAQGAHGPLDLQEGDPWQLGVVAVGAPVLWRYHDPIAKEQLVDGSQLLQGHQHPGHHGGGSNAVVLARLL